MEEHLNSHSQFRAKDAVGVFTNQHDLDEAIAELEASHFPRHNISVVGDKSKLVNRFGSDAVEPEVLDNNPMVPKDAPLRIEEKNIGAGVIVSVPGYIVACIAGIIVYPASTIVLVAAMITGGIIGAGLGFLALTMIKAKRDARIQRQIDKGGLTLWVKTLRPEEEKAAQTIMMNHGAKNVHLNG